MAKKKFAIIGLGNFGATVARELADLECEVTAIDIDRDKVQALVDEVALAIVGDSTEREFLENLDAEQFDCIVVSTGKDSHASILVALHLKELSAQKIVVKANSRDHAKVLVKVGASEAIIPEAQAAIRLSRSLVQPNLLEHLPLSQNFSVAEIKPTDDFIGKQLKELEFRSKYHLQVVAVRDTVDGDLEMAPGGNYEVKANDMLIVLGKDEDIEHLRVRTNNKN